MKLLQAITGYATWILMTGAASLWVGGMYDEYSRPMLGASVVTISVWFACVMANAGVGKQPKV